MKTFEIEEKHAGSSIEKFLIRVAGFGPRTALKKAFQQKQILVNSRAVGRDRILHVKDLVQVLAENVFSKEDVRIEPAVDAHLQVIVESSDFIMVAKPAGQSAHPLRPSDTETTLNAIAGQFPEAAAPMRLGHPLEGGLIHRLDRGTSGALVCARNREGFRKLQKVWKSRTVEKVYLAWVHGNFEKEGRVSLFLTHDPKSPKRMACFVKKPERIKSWPTRTSFYPVKTMGNATLLLIRIHTGVMHQIRATCATLGHPVVADAIYKGLRGASNSGAKVASRGGLTPKLSPLDEDTRVIFREIARKINIVGAPKPEDLPKNGFFLHALWLRSEAIPELLRGCIATVPDYFGVP